MKRQLSVTSRQELMDSLRARYRSGSRVEKCRILDEVVAVTELPVSRDPELETFLKSLRTAWQRGEVRRTHAVPPKPSRDWRTRLDPFEHAWPLVRRWLEAEPDRTAKELFQRLQVAQPDTFPDRQIRTLQRRVQAWRTAEARRLILANPSADKFSHDFAPTLG